MYNLVGFQTKLTYPEQRRVFSLVPALREARFLRYGAVHRNSYVDGAAHLLPNLETRARPGLFLAGQLSGVEGYAESIASGLAAALSVLFRLEGLPDPEWPPRSMLAGLLGHVTSPRKGDPQPMNANFGLLPEPAPGKKRERKGRQAAAALEAVRDFRDRFLLPLPGPWRQGDRR
jgi:methylenetetrahydrofolate--tRNA-(uracil-5-)-methyltransferase